LERRSFHGTIMDDATGRGKGLGGKPRSPTRVLNISRLHAVEGNPAGAIHRPQPTVGAVLIRGVALVGGVVTEFAAPEPASFVVVALLGLAQVGTARLRNRRRRGLVA
jgi:hypothetical protein